MKVISFSLIASIAILTSANAQTSSQITFSCQTNEGILTTVAQSSSGKTLPIFVWKNEALPKSTDIKKLCAHVTQKLENYRLDGYDLSNVSFIGSAIEDVPVICASSTKNSCSKVLLALSPVTDNPRQVADEVLNSILNPQLQTTQRESNTR